MTVPPIKGLQMTDKQLDKHLKRFIGKSQNRAWITKGYTDNITTFATDSHKILKISHSKENNLISTDDKYFNKYKELYRSQVDLIFNGSFHKIKLTRDVIKQLITVTKMINQLKMLVEFDYNKERNQYTLRAKTNSFSIRDNMEIPIELEYSLTSFGFCCDDNKVQPKDNKILFNAQYFQYMLEFAYDNKDEYIEMYVPNDSKFKPIAIFGDDHTFSIILLPVRPN